MQSTVRDVSDALPAITWLSIAESHPAELESAVEAAGIVLQIDRVDEVVFKSCALTALGMNICKRTLFAFMLVQRGA